MTTVYSTTRVEPVCRGGDPGRGLAATVQDPFWMLARQQQFGELGGADAGTPAQVAFLQTEVTLDGWSPAGGGVLPYAPQSDVVEALVAGEAAGPAHSTSDRVQAGRALAAALPAAVAAQLRSAFPLPLEPDAPRLLARAAAAFADTRRKQRAGATRRYPPDDVAAFDPHVLLELDSLRSAIVSLDFSVRVREALGLVLSALLVKLSRRASDTSAGASTRRLAAGYPAKLFIRKAEDLAKRVAAMEALVPADIPPARVALDDASRLQTLGASTIDAVVTSPPYVATYDYLAHHALRLRWLDLDARAFSEGEIGARRHYGTLDARDAREVWAHELGAALRAMSRVCRKGAPIALLLADSAVQGEALRADELIASVADSVGLVFRARASQTRPHFHGPTAAAFRDAPRAEHAIALEKR